jgi:hypothetical protein
VKPSLASVELLGGARPGVRFGRALLVGAALLVGLGAGSPAAADPAGPTNYDSRLLGVGSADGASLQDLPVRFEILGGDSFLVVRADPGTEVEVPGYDGEPYVRISPDGTVEVNQRSPARWLNDARYGAEEVDVPADADPDAPPRWEVVADDGEYAWHDHRIHWMAPSVPRQVDPAAGEPQPVMDWQVPVLVDGTSLTVSGELLWVPGPSPVVPVGAAAVALLGAVALAWARPSWVPAAVAIAGVLTLGVGLTKTTRLPTGADADPFLVVLPVLALAAVALGLALGRRAARPAATIVTTAGGLPLLVWVVLQAGALTRPIVPGPLSVTPVRSVLVAAAAAGSAGLLVAARTALAATALDPAGTNPSAGPDPSPTRT